LRHAVLASEMSRHIINRGVLTKQKSEPKEIDQRLASILYAHHTGLS
jgi:hypothetical protein